MAVTYVLSAVILLGVCIFVHELGHLLGGMMVGVKARVFSMGYGPGFIKKKWGDTTWQITLIPFGGYCAFYGDNPSEQLEGKNYEFFSVHPLKRIVIVIMGPLFNLFFGIILFFAMNLAGYEVESSRIYIPEMLKSGETISPAHRAGLIDGDQITAINGKKVSSYMDIQSIVSLSNGDAMNVDILRAGKTMSFTVTPEKNPQSGYQLIGVYPYGEKVLLAGVVEGEVAAAAGLQRFDEIVSINGLQVKSADQFVSEIKKLAGKTARLGVLRKGKAFEISLIPRQKERVTVSNFEDSRFAGKNVGSVVIDDVGKLRKSIAAGKVLVEGTPVTSIEELTEKTASGAQIEIPGASYRGSVSYESFGFLGVQPVISPEKILVHHSLPKAFVRAIVEPFEFISLNFKGLGLLITGKINARENLSGPVRIAVIAGDTMAYQGVREFILLMARISVILMMMNLLPIPAVDGSHILIYIIEAIRRKKMSVELMERIQMVGVFIMIILGIFVFMNDITQVFF